MGPVLQLVGFRISFYESYHESSNFAECRYCTKFKWPYFATARCYTYMVGYAGSPTCTVHVDLTLTRSKVNVNVTGLLNFRQLPKPCMLAAMTAAPLRGFLVCARCIYVRGSVLLRYVDDRLHRLSAGRGWRECTARSKCNLWLPCLFVVSFLSLIL